MTWLRLVYSVRVATFAAIWEEAGDLGSLGLAWGNLDTFVPMATFIPPGMYTI